MLHKAISNLKNQEGEGEGGFTLIELLVVILIIGILAAIALPTFLGQSDKAKDSSAKSDARNAVSQIESAIADGKTPDQAIGAGATPTHYATTELNQFKTIKSIVTVGANGYKIVADKRGPGTDTDENGTWYSITKSGDAPGGYVYAAGKKASGYESWTENGNTTTITPPAE